MATLKSPTSGVNQETDTVSQAARVALYGTDGTPIARAAGSVRALTDQALGVGGLNDEAWRPLRMDRTGGLALANLTSLFSEPFEGTTLAASRLLASSATYTQAQNATGMTLNSAASVAASAYSILTSLRQFPKYQRAPLHYRVRARLSLVANAGAELGFGAPATTAAIAVGAYWQVTTGNAVQPVVTFNGVDQVGTAVTMPSGWQSNFYTWDVIVDDDEVLFTIMETSTGVLVAERKIFLATTQQKLWNATHLPVFVRVYSSASVPVSAPVIIVAAMDVNVLDLQQNKPWGQVQALNGAGAHVLPTAFTQAAQFANNTAPASATLSNTVAGYTTLGGLFQFAAPAGAVTDFALFGFNVPAPYTFVCTGIDIDAWNTGAASATTPTLLQWGLGVDQSAVSLAGTTVRVPLGAQSIPVGAAIGARADRNISVDFSAAPLTTNAGRFFDVILRIPIGTSTASQIIQGSVTVKGYFE